MNSPLIFAALKTWKLQILLQELANLQQQRLVTSDKIRVFTRTKQTCKYKIKSFYTVKSKTASKSQVHFSLDRFSLDKRYKLNVIFVPNRVTTDGRCIYLVEDFRGNSLLCIGNEIIKRGNQIKLEAKYVVRQF